jgi:hypothetical protein
MNRLLLECAAAQILIDFRGVLEPAVISHTFRGWKCTVLIEPDPASIPILTADQIPTACEAAVLYLLRSTGRRMLRPEIVAALESDHGESTIEKSLAKLVKAKKIDRVNRRGYAIVTHQGK